MDFYIVYLSTASIISCVNGNIKGPRWSVFKSKVYAGIAHLIKKKNNAENTLICSFPVEGFHQNSIIVDTELRVCLYDKVQNTSVFQ